MEYRTLGRSGCSVSTLALGTMTFGNETDEAGSHAQLDAFVEAGGTLVDTADVYTAGVSEQIIGSWLAGRPDAREHVVLATKGRFPMGDGPNDVGLSRRHLAAALDASLRRLGVERLDLYQVHAYDPHTPIEETLGVLSDAVSAGKVHYIGLSNFTGWQLQRAVDVAEHRHLSVPVMLQPQYNLLAREIEWEIVPAARANGLGLLPWSPLGGGWLTVSASDLTFTGYAAPRALELDELPGIIAAFASAARRALDAGFDLVELHAAHGYLLHQFLSPLSNQRTDEYGGSLENRIRFHREALDAVRAVWPERLPLTMRMRLLLILSDA